MSTAEIVWSCLVGVGLGVPVTVLFDFLERRSQRLLTPEERADQEKQRRRHVPGVSYSSIE